ncbi:hypothetical protein CIK77_00505 [Microbacterium sp. JB110]|nr:hypothetical protein CIK77_00505 [Microbacterium sp. JB110]
MVGDGVDAVLSEAFLVALRRRGSFGQSSDSARRWLLGIATRVMKRRRASGAAARDGDGSSWR